MSIPYNSKNDISFSFLFPPIGSQSWGPNKYNQPKQNTETSKQSLEKKTFFKKKARFY